MTGPACCVLRAHDRVRLKQQNDVTPPRAIRALQEAVVTVGHAHYFSGNPQADFHQHVN
jgi:hypothetical protein